MMKKVIAIAFVAIIVFSLCACSGGKSAFVGTWVSNEQYWESINYYYKETYVFYASGTGDYRSVLTRPRPGEKEGEIKSSCGFTWEIKSGDVIIQKSNGHIETFSFDGKTLIKRSNSNYVMHKKY